MLPPSVRRVVASSPQAAALASSLAPSSAAPASLFFCGHQRRCSSSKPSRPDDGSGDMHSSVPASPSSSSSASARAGGKAGSDKRKRKNKEPSAAGPPHCKLPSVPTTNHMSKEAIGLSSFFSLHRPISITQTMPRSVSDEHFASIFAAHANASKVAETISTLSDTVNQLQGSMGQLTIETAHEDDDHARADGMRKVDFRNPDGSESSLYVQVDAMSGDFSPYCPPPLPRPQSDADADAEDAAAAPEAFHRQRPSRVYTAVVNLEEVMDPDGQMRLVAHSSLIVSDASRSFLARMARRQLSFDEAMDRRAMLAISVKRQRKLKMKKKKYKKLMRRTRNLRRKLDRT